MVGIIGAMKVEVDSLSAEIENKTPAVISGIEFTYGKLCGKDAVIACSGCGKVNAAMCTQIMIDKFSPDIIINIGVAGALASGMQVCDTAVAQSVCQYDFDTSPLGDPIGFISGIDKTYFECDRNIIDTLKKTCPDKERLFTGIIASGDKFVNSKELSAFIVDNFSAVACEMEGGAIGHVCCANGVPFGVLRTISDSSDGSSHLLFTEFSAIAAEKACKHIKSFLEEFSL